MTSNTTINLSDMPVWDFTITVRGIEVVLVAPMDIAQDTTEGVPLTKQQLDAEFKRWPGLVAWIIRFIVGHKRIDTPLDGGAEALRAVVLLQVGEHHQELVDSITTAECMQINAAYMECQQQWYEAAHAYAAKVVDNAYASPAPTGGPLHMQRSDPTGQPLIPGEIPAVFRNTHSPMVTGTKTEIAEG